MSHGDINHYTVDDNERWRVVSAYDPMYGTQDMKRHQAKIAGLYAVLIFSGLFLLSGVIVMFSDRLPDWTSRLLLPEQSALASGLPQADAASNGFGSELKLTLTPMTRTAAFSETQLDHGTLRLLTLQRPLALSGTSKGSGLEYFTYHAFTLRQLADQLPVSPSTDAVELKQRLAQLSTLSDEMAGFLEAALREEFNGVPSPTLRHLVAKEAALANLSHLNQKPLRLVSIAQDGGAFGGSFDVPGPKPPFIAGDVLQTYQQQFSDLQADPTFQSRYPQAKALLLKQHRQIVALAKHLELRWESVLPCSHKSNGKAQCLQTPSRMRIYVRQGLNEQAFASQSDPQMIARLSIARPKKS